MTDQENVLRVWFDGKSVRVLLPSPKGRLKEISVSTLDAALRLEMKIPADAPVVIENFPSVTFPLEGAPK